MANRLQNATSPYLLQHKDNPVEWYEWGPDAFAAAGQREVPIMLSVGYSACHWCHVMAHESFEDPDTAAYLNEHFVNVKVDREERPDVDAVYMEVTQAMTGSGGGHRQSAQRRPRRRRTTTPTAQISILYGMLDRVAPSAVVTLNRAVAVAMANGPQAGLELLAPLLADDAFQRHHRLHAVRAHLLELAGDADAAATNYRLAARLTASPPEQRYLEQRLLALGG